MKNYFDKIKSANIQVWAIAHSKYKNIKDKANVDNEGYMQLSSNLSAAYEAALGDIFDVVLTGIIDRNIETVGDGDNAKRYATDAIRKLYFRGTPEIDAGGRFAADSVPEYLVFDKPNMAKDFIRVIEEGMEKSKTNFTASTTKSTLSTTTKNPPVSEESAPDEEDDELLAALKATMDSVDDPTESEPEDILDEEPVEEEDPTPVDKDTLAAIRAEFKSSSADAKSQIKTILSNYGGRLVGEMRKSDVEKIKTILGI